MFLVQAVWAPTKFCMFYYFVVIYDMLKIMVSNFLLLFLQFINIVINLNIKIKQFQIKTLHNFPMWIETKYLLLFSQT